jgi:hypothetical protein
MVCITTHLIDIILKVRQEAINAVRQGAICESVGAAARKVIDDP